MGQQFKKYSGKPLSDDYAKVLAASGSIMAKEKESARPALIFFVGFLAGLLVGLFCTII